MSWSGITANRTGAEWLIRKWSSAPTPSAARGFPSRIALTRWGVKRVATAVEHGEAIGFMPGEPLREARFADVWASNLTVHGFIEAAKTQATGT